MPSPPAAVREFFKTVLQQVYHFKVDVIAGDANAAAYKYYKRQEHQDLHDSSVAVMLKEMQRELNTGHPFERRLHMDHSTNNHPNQLHAANDIDCCFMAILSWRKPAGPRIMRKLWSNLKPNHSVNFREQIADLRERTDYPRRKRTEDISRERGESIESQLRAAAQRPYRDQEIRESPGTPKR